MSSADQNTDTPRGMAWCAWHDGLSDTARLIQAVEAATGSGGNQFACAGCRESYGLIPLADQVETARALPPANALTRAQHDGHACVWCGKKLWHGAISAGIARGKVGAVVLDIEVYACPGCAPLTSPNSEHTTGDTP